MPQDFHIAGLVREVEADGDGLHPLVAGAFRLRWEPISAIVGASDGCGEPRKKLATWTVKTKTMERQCLVQP
jgi:hypothetical protein